MKKAVIVLLTLSFLAFGVSLVSADYIGDISYDYVDNTGGNYTFTFTVNNNSTGADIGELDFFQIDFDADSDESLYSSIAWTADKGWLSDAWEYDPSFGGIPGGVNADDSVFGSNGGGIAQSNSLGGFSVNFDYSGGIDPTQQLFTWYANFGTSDIDNGGMDLGGYWALGEASGSTRYEPSGSPPAIDPIPEPATMLLLGTGLAGLLGIWRKRFMKS